MLAFPSVASRFSRTGVITLAILVLLALTYEFRSTLTDRTTWPLQHIIPAPEHNVEDFTRFGASLFELLDANAPQTAHVQRLENASPEFFHNINEDTARPDLTSLGLAETSLLKAAHMIYLDKARQLQLPYNKGTRGIVSTAGGAFLPIFIVSLRMLRRTGCTLPVELFLKSEEEHGPYICDTLLPSLNARCVRLDGFLADKASTIAKYQFKVFSILFSSFEEVLLFDADNFPAHDPTSLFTSEPFTSHGLILWPDFWASSASHHFFDIQGTPVPPLTLRATTESGQLMVNKPTHGTALLMAAYYNFYGPGYYYPLQTQGGPGEGDKETFLAGAEAAGQPYYQVKQLVRALGYEAGTGFHGVAMLQYDAEDDWATTMGHASKDEPRAFAVHANFPKLDPTTLFKEGMGVESPTISPATGKHHRMWGPVEANIVRFGKDLEQDLWEEIRFVACELGDKFRHWHSLPDTTWQKGTCSMVQEHIELVFPDIKPRPVETATANE